MKTKEEIKTSIIEKLDAAEKSFMLNLIASGESKKSAELYASAYRAGMNIGIVIFTTNQYEMK